MSLALCSFASNGIADDTTLTFSPSTNTTPAMLDVMVGTAHVPVQIPPQTPATTKRNLVRSALQGAGYQVIDNGLAGSSLTIQSLPSNVHVKISTGSTGEAADRIVTSTPVHPGTIAFDGVFNPIGPLNQPAIFTAGIVTEVGVLSATVTSQQLNFQTDGPIICQALFQRLAPRAPQYGAQINYAGDRLEVYFDPAYTVTQGGVIFGTTSLSPGVSGSMGSQSSCVADIDNGTGLGIPDGGVGIEDLLFYLHLYDTGDLRADVDNGSGTGVHDGGVGIEDLLYYLSRYDQGC
jgi:hypothetical protein